MRWIPSSVPWFLWVSTSNNVTCRLPPVMIVMRSSCFSGQDVAEITSLGGLLEIFSSQITEDIIKRSSLVFVFQFEVWIDVLSLPHQTVGRTSLRAVEEADQLNELCNLLTAKDFQARREGVVLLLDHCKSSPRFVSTNIFQVCRASLLLLSC